jgi:hypothetical protein
MYAPYSSQPPPRRGIPIWVFIVAGALLLGLGTCGGLLAFCADAASKDTGGTLVGKAIPAAKVKQLNERRLLDATERVVALYDASLSEKMSDVAVVTTEHVIHATDSTTASMKLADIATIDHRDDGLIGDTITVVSKKGERLEIIVAPFNGGVSFLNALADETRKNSPSVVVRRATPQ